MFRNVDWRAKNRLVKALLGGLLTLLLIYYPGSHAVAYAAGKDRSAKVEQPQPAAKLTSEIAEVAPPEAIQALNSALQEYQPQVTILSPKPDEVIDDDSVSIRFQVKDLPIFKDEKLGLGPHLHILLDNRGYQAVYDLNKPLTLEHLEPGTHTIRAFASRPWHESFKNEGAFTQLTFHIYTKTQENNPSRDLPLLTYSRPQGSYGAEPIMLDFYLTNAPLHLVAQEASNDEVADWRIRCTVNGKSFVIDRWQPVYLKGFKPGKNWLQLEFLDEKGNPVKNVFNNTVRVITYEPDGKDTLSRLVRGDLSAQAARGIVDPDYIPPVPVIPSPAVSPPPPPAPIAPATPIIPPARPTPTPEVKVSPAPELKPTQPKAIAPAPSPTTTPTPQIKQVPQPELPPTEKPGETKLPGPPAKPEQPKSPTPKPSPQPSFLERLRSITKPAKPSPVPVSPPSKVKPSPSVQSSPSVRSSPSPTPEPQPERSPGAPSPKVEPQLTPTPTPSISPTLAPRPQSDRQPPATRKPKPPAKVAPAPSPIPKRDDPVKTSKSETPPSSRVEQRPLSAPSPTSSPAPAAKPEAPAPKSTVTTPPTKPQAQSKPRLKPEDILSRFRRKSPASPAPSPSPPPTETPIPVPPAQLTTR